MEAMCKTGLSVLKRLYVCVCALLAGEAWTAPQTHRQMHTNLWHVYEGVWVIKKSIYEGYIPRHTHFDMLWQIHTHTSDALQQELVV